MEYYLQDRVAPSGFELHCKPHAAIWTRVPCNTAAMVVRAGPVHISFKSAESAMAAYSLVVAAASAAFALPGGIVSDKVGRLPVLAVCWLLGVRATAPDLCCNASACLSFAVTCDWAGRLVRGFRLRLVVPNRAGDRARVWRHRWRLIRAVLRSRRRHRSEPGAQLLAQEAFSNSFALRPNVVVLGSSLEGHEHLHVGVHGCPADRAVRMRWRHQLVQGRLCVRTPFGLLVHEM